MLELIKTINTHLNNFIWGVPAMVCIIGVGLYLSARTGFIQIRKFGYALRCTVGRMFKKREASDGAITPFQAVCTALAATVGTGNIAGVAGAIALGGPALCSGCGSPHCWVCVQNSLKSLWQSISGSATKRATMWADLCTTSKTAWAKNGSGLHIYMHSLVSAPCSAPVMPHRSTPSPLPLTPHC